MERQKEEADQSRLVSGSFNKQGTLCMRLVLGSHKTGRTSQPPTRFLKVYIEALMGFSHVYSPSGLNDTVISEDCVLENSSHCRNDGQNIYSKDKGGGEESTITCF